jgi:hypothetical protein
LTGFEKVLKGRSEQVSPHLKAHLGAITVMDQAVIEEGMILVNYRVGLFVRASDEPQVLVAS